MTYLEDETDLAASSLHDIEARLAPELKEPERIVLALLNNRRPVVAAALRLTSRETTTSP